MALVLRNIVIQYDALYEVGEENNGTPLPMHLQPHMLFMLFAIYLWVVKGIGPKLMADRKPFKLRGIMLTYNAGQVLFNMYIWIMAVRELLHQDDPLIRNCIQATPMMLHLNKMYLLNKITDLIETVIFVLRKKDNQVSFLHVYHHMAVITGCYISTMVAPATESVFTGTLNAIVHTVMYCYYFMSIYDAKLVAQFPSFKQRLTQMQLTQFVLITIHMSKTLFFGACDFPKSLALVSVLQNMFLVCMFSDFYYRTYLVKRHKISAQPATPGQPMLAEETPKSTALTADGGERPPRIMRRAIVVA